MRLLSQRIARFFGYVSVDPAGGCWTWEGAKNNKGYGTYRGAGAHRFSYRMYRGEIWDGNVIDHLCRNPACVNPRHLQQVSYRENFRRGVHHAALGMCIRGHAISGDNVYVFMTRGVEQRCCRICRMESRRRWILNRQHSVKGVAS